VVDGEELVTGLSCRCQALHNGEEMIFGPFWVWTSGRDDKNPRLGNHTLTVLSFLLNSFHIALARTILLVLHVADILTDGLVVTSTNLKLLVYVCTR
jgi:hypothetical protein